jgi:hypothetical protein
MFKKMSVIITISLFFSFFIVLGIGSVNAKDDACKADIEKFCKGVQPGQGRIAKCLKDHDSELSQECKAHITK